jgi:hypothetical protein
MSSISLPDEYVGVAQRGFEALRTGRGGWDAPPEDGDPRWGLSAILRLGGAVAERLAGVADELKPFVGSHHIWYSETSSHTTLRSFEAHRSNVIAEDENLSRYTSLVAEAVAGRGPIRIAYEGILPSPAGLLVAGHPAGLEEMAQLRSTIHAGLMRGGPLTGPERDGPRTLFHASLCVFMGEIADPGASMELLQSNADRSFGEMEFDEIEIVSYRRTLDSVSIVPWSTIPLSG